MAGERMLQFVRLDRETPVKRPALERSHDFHEIYQGFAAAKAAEQASRCSQCGVPLPGDDPEEIALCDTCLTEERPWSAARAALSTSFTVIIGWFSTGVSWWADCGQ